MGKTERKTPFSLRLSPELHQRLQECADELKQKKHSLAQQAIEAAVEAIERNGNRLVVPIEFTVTHKPAPVIPEKYPSHRAEHSLVEESTKPANLPKTDQKIAGILKSPANRKTDPPK